MHHYLWATRCTPYSLYVLFNATLTMPVMTFKPQSAKDLEAVIEAKGVVEGGLKMIVHGITSVLILYSNANV